MLIASPITKQRLDLLATHLTVGETYFFREPSAFEAERNGQPARQAGHLVPLGLLSF